VTDIDLSMADRGRTVPIRVGDRVVLSLPENPTTGLRWTLPKNDSMEVLTDKNVTGGQGIGAAGLRILTLQPTRAGSIPLRLLRHQAWESEESADEEFEVNLDVR
jgi:inhibitor of cysteine peptidase